jgi:L-ascorbate metabolism protein UlaG (beta-lactamase superfamily)
MNYSRRDTLQLGAGALGGLGLASAMPRAAGAQSALAHATDGGEIVIHPVEHASLVLEVPGLVIHVDPVGDPAAYADLPPPGLILITHEHGDHYDAATLAALARAETRLLTNPAVHALLPAELQARATAIANGEATSANGIGIEAVPAYNLTADRLQFHPRGRDNGYVLAIDGRRVYVAGDTEDIPEMRALEGIDIAFVPMNLPYTMDVVQAASAVREFAPRVVYPYHYGESDTAEFLRLVTEAGGTTEVVLADWYPAG